MKKISYIILSFIALAMATACSSDDSATPNVVGSIDGAKEGSIVLIQGFHNNSWYNIDSLKVDKDGKFEGVVPVEKDYPDVFRAVYNDMIVYFPIDSTETITIKSKAASFDRDYTLAGSQTAIDMMNVDHKIDSLIRANGADATRTNAELKAYLNNLLLNQQSPSLSYYIINKTIGDKPLYDVKEKADLKMVGAVANKFNVRWPNDPRTKVLADLFIRQNASVSGYQHTIEAPVTGFTDNFEINLYDEFGHLQSLKEKASKGNVVVLSFTNYSIEASTPYNIELNKMYEKYADKGLEIYQIAIGNDEIKWRSSAKNLPWTTVWSDASQGFDAIASYNVNPRILPQTFIIDRQGDIVARITDIDSLEQEVAKYM